jgi:hypothetical protein
MRTWKAALGLAAILTVPAHAGVIGPTRPSDLVNVLATPGGSGTVCGGQAVAFDMRQMADGTQVPFTIPPGQVFVVTGYDWAVDIATPSRSNWVSVVAQVGPSCNFSLSGSGAIADPQGTASSSITFPNGIAVKPDALLGAYTWDGNLNRANLYGYFTKDK